MMALVETMVVAEFLRSLCLSGGDGICFKRYFECCGNAELVIVVASEMLL